MRTDDPLLIDHLVEAMAIRSIQSEWIFALRADPFDHRGHIVWSDPCCEPLICSEPETRKSCKA
jgi:hypothetical protein